MSIPEASFENRESDERNGAPFSQIFDRHLNKWLDVGPDFYNAYNRWRNSIFERKRYNNRCSCPKYKWWYCDGICEDCCYEISDNTVSLDTTAVKNDSNRDYLIELIKDPAQPLCDTVSDKLLTKHILNRLNDLMPEAVEIGSLRLLGLSDEAIAKVVGINRTTFLYRLEKARNELRQEFGDDFDF